MYYQIVGMILFYLQLTASQNEILIQQSPTEILKPPGKTAQIDCKISRREHMLWYKELQNGSLHRIHWSYEYAPPSNEKYSSKVDSTTNTHSLIIRNVQREDSGVYYCGLAAYIHPDFGTGTRLIVTDASEPRLSILVPSALEDAELPPLIPLLCLLSDFTPPWKTVLWDTGGEEFEGQMDAGAIDEKGIFSVWSHMTILSQTWNQGTAYTCTAKEKSTGKHISATVSKEAEGRDAGDCMIVLYAGLPCMFILLLMELLILLCRKYRIRGRAVQRGNQIPMRKIPQTEYATLPYNRNIPL